MPKSFVSGLQPSPGTAGDRPGCAEVQSTVVQETANTEIDRQPAAATSRHFPRDPGEWGYEKGSFVSGGGFSPNAEWMCCKGLDAGKPGCAYRCDLARNCRDRRVPRPEPLLNGKLRHVQSAFMAHGIG